MNRSIWIGFDPREAAAYAVTRASVRHHVCGPMLIKGLVLEDLQRDGLYTRPMERRLSVADRSVLWDTISNHPMSTEFAISRFLVPHLAGEGWAAFMDCDMLARANLTRMFDALDPSFAVYCVKHDHRPRGTQKMDGQVQSQYSRKNWSSFCVFNCDHPANKALTVELVNTLPGRDLHRFCWLDDSEIGELGPEWNFLVGHSDPSIEPKVVHFTEGTQHMPGYENVPYADEWRHWLNRWAA